VYIIVLDGGEDGGAKEAIALYNFQARNKRELSFSKGDVLTLYERLSADWWEAVNSDDLEGLVPDKYVRVIGRFVLDLTTFNPNSNPSLCSNLRPYNLTKDCFLP
jgi:hypothetical protein